MTRKILVLALATAALLIVTSPLAKNSSQPVAIVLPHHNIVKEKRLEFLKLIESKRNRTDTIVLLSPDHFSPGQHGIYYTDRTWDLSNGQIDFDQNLGPKITTSLTKDNVIVKDDHGIFNILPDIKTVWPKAKIVPILIGQEINFSSLETLEKNLEKNCKQNCLLMASIDFSHYLPRSLADIHDTNNTKALTNLTVSSRTNVEADSPQSMYLLTSFAKSKNALSWNLFAHTNSGWLTGNRDAETTSHFMGWYSSEHSKTQAYSTESFLVGPQINDSKKDLLGSRFFYGVDHFDASLKGDYSPTSIVTIKSTTEESKIETENEHLTIQINKDWAISGYSREGKTSLLLLPLGEKDGSNLLLRGEEKTSALKKLLSPIEANKQVSVDMQEGTVILWR